MDARWLVAVVVVLAPAPAWADDDAAAFTIGSRPVWFVTAGATGGGTVKGDAGGAGFVGGEVSLVRLRDARFTGLYADAYYDFGADGTYVTAGPEVGWIRRSRTFPISLGLDGGGAARFADDTAWGGTARVFVSFVGSLSVYARYAYLDADEPDHVVQLGVTFKFALGPPFGAGTRRAR
jgi:hypothetical protein